MDFLKFTIIISIAYIQQGCRIDHEADPTPTTLSLEQKRLLSNSEWVMVDAVIRGRSIWTLNEPCKTDQIYHFKEQGICIFSKGRRFCELEKQSSDTFSWQFLENGDFLLDDVPVQIIELTDHSLILSQNHIEGVFGRRK